MSQYDFGNLSSPLSGTTFFDTHLEPWRNAVHSSHSGTSRPGYAVAQMMWVDTTSTPWILKMFDGTDDITMGTINATTNAFTPAGGILNNITATTAPTVNEDSGDGYSAGSIWVNLTTDLIYICVDASSGAAVWKNILDTNSSQTLTNKTLTAPVIAAISNGGTITIPTGTDTLVGRATTDTLTNKTLNLPVISGITDASTASAGNVGEQLSTAAGAASSAVTISNATPAVITWTGHGFTAALNANTPIYFTTTGALPAGLSINTTYYIIGSSITTNTFQVATTVDNAVAGTAVNTSSAGSGTHTASHSAYLATGSTTNIMGLRLTAGCWEVTGNVSYLPNAATTITQIRGGISTTTGAFGTNAQLAATTILQASFTTGGFQQLSFGTWRVNVSAATTVYLLGVASFGTNIMQCYGFMRAIRVQNK